MCYSSHFKDTLTLESQPFIKRMEILIFDTHWLFSAKISPSQFTQQHSSDACLFTLEKTCDRVLEANKKQVPLKSYSLEIRIDSVNQFLKNKEKVK